MPKTPRRRSGAEYSRCTLRMMGVVRNNAERRDRSKGSLIVEALRSGDTDAEAFARLVDAGEVPSVKTIRSYRTMLRALGYAVKTDAELRAANSAGDIGISESQ